MKKLLKNNSGEGYIFFIGMTVVILLFFGALFSVLQIESESRSIKKELNQAANECFSVLRSSWIKNEYNEDGSQFLKPTGTVEDNYDSLINGSTDFTHITWLEPQFSPDFNQELFNLFAERLHLSVTDGEAIKLGVKGNLLYKITDFKYEYFQTLYKNDGTSGILIGDLNLDGSVDDTDLAILENYLIGDNSHGLELTDVDIDSSGVVDSGDIIGLKNLIYYYANRVEAQSVLIISFKMEMPINLGAFTFGTSIDEYVYPFAVSFK